MWLRYAKCRASYSVFVSVLAFPEAWAPPTVTANCQLPLAQTVPPPSQSLIACMAAGKKKTNAEETKGWDGSIMAENIARRAQ